MAREIKRVSSDAKLTESISGNTTFSMSLRSMPVSARDKFKRLKAEGKITGSMNDYLRRAFIEQLKRDDI